MKQIYLILAFILALPSLCNAQKKRALLVGISKYHSYGYKVWNNIHGAEDVALLTPELKKKGFSIQTLINEQATYQGIVNSLNKLIVASKKGDVIYLHFSCHGQPVEDGLNSMQSTLRGGDADVKKELATLFNQVSTADDISPVIDKLQKIYDSRYSEYEYRQYADDIAWYLALAYLKDDNIDKAKELLQPLAVKDYKRDNKSARKLYESLK